MRESSGVASGLSGNPGGGGGISALGDRFQPDLVKGTGNYSIPINLPKGPNEIAPNMALVYSTGAGNGVFGMGWQMETLKIERRSDRGIPKYNEEDSFVFASGVVLVKTGQNTYRPKADNIFWQFEFIDNTWHIATADGKKIVLGNKNESREIGGQGVFGWYLDSITDPSGNQIVYNYVRHGETLYLNSVEYGIFRVQIIYEDRSDILRNGKAGFLRTIAQRAISIDIHCNRLAPSLMRSYTLQYIEAVNKVSLLSNVLLNATLNGETAVFPELKLHYTGIDFNQYEVRDIEAFVAPPSLSNSSTQLVDLHGDGLPDILQTATSRTYLWKNDGNGKLEGPVALQDIPSTMDLSKKNVAFADLDGNGRVDLFSTSQPLQLMFSNSGKGGFEPEPTVFKNTTHLRLSAPSNRLMDVDGDGVIDILETSANHFLLYKHEKYLGWQEPIVVNKRNDMEVFPHLMLGEKGVYLENMKGDGLQDLLWLKSGQVCYWPYLGNGNWGNMIEMLHPPVFPRGYREERILLTDMDGDGCTDIVYVGDDSTSVWINQSGNGFADAVEIPFSPGAAWPVIPADFYGDGRPGLIWSGNRPGYNSSGYRFLQFDAGIKPYLLCKIENGMGGINEMQYSTSTRLRADDRSKGREWLFQLPFPMQVVTTIRQTDTINGRVIEQKINYHDGVFDGWERDFRGFTHVESTMSGDDSLPATRQELSFFHGDPDHTDLIERERQKLLAGSLLTTKVYEIFSSFDRLREESVQKWDVLLLDSTPGGDIFFPFLKEIKTTEHTITDQPARIEISRYEDLDLFGNPGKRIRQSFADGQPEAEWLVTEEKFSYINNVANNLVKLPCRTETYDGKGMLMGTQIKYYDGDEFEGLPEGQVTKGLITRVIELKLIPSGMPAGYGTGRNFADLGYMMVNVNGEDCWFSPTTSVARDNAGNVTRQKDAKGNILTIVYDDDHLYPVSAISSTGDITHFQFNPRSGEPELTEFADGRVVRNEYDPIGRLIATFEKNEQGTENLVKAWSTNVLTLPVYVISFAPKTGGRLLAEFKNAVQLEALDNVSISKCVFSGLGTQMGEITTGPKKSNGDKQFVLSGRAIINPKGSVAVQFPPVFVDNFEFIPPGNDLSGVIRYFYDYKGSNIGTAGPGSVHFKVIKDNFTVAFYEGQAAGVVGLGQPPAGKPSRIEHYDAKGRVIKIIEMDGDNIASNSSYILTSDGLLEKLKDHNDEELISYSFAGPDNAVSITHRDIGRRVYYRDALNKLVERINPDGSSLHFSYDAVGRLTQIDRQETPASNKQTLRKLFYDSDPGEASDNRFLKGKLALVKEGEHEFRYSYTKSGKLREETIITGDTRLSNKWEFNIQGEATAVIYPDGKKITYTREDCGMVKKIDNIADDFMYDTNGSLMGYKLNNGMIVQMSSDAGTRKINSISATLNDTVLRRLQYEYDGIGNIAAIKDEMKNAATEWHAYEYDSLFRVTKDNTRFEHAGGALLHSSSYTYDAAGNLTQFNDLQSQEMQYMDMVRKGRLTGISHGAESKSIHYDGNGNIFSVGDLRKILYDGFDRLASVEMLDKTITINYDQEGRRVQKKLSQNGNVKITRYAAGLYELNQQTAIRHIFLDKLLICSETRNLVSEETVQAYYLSDHHGTVLLATDAVGNILANQKYSAFGSVVNNSAALNKYLGRDRDSETALLQLGIRCYASFLGRFISPDWYVLENPQKVIGIPQAFNIYSYAVNNPLVFKDPSGMFAIAVIGVIAAIIYIAAIVTAVAFTVGFIAGLVYGLSTGMGWESLLRGLEAGLTTAVGMWLGAITGMLVGSLFGPGGMLVGAFTGGIIGGLNGAVSGSTGIYDWSSWKGWGAFIADSTWGLTGTALGLVVHAINIGWGKYRSDLSERQNRHVYESGVRVKSGFAFAMGNVISNAGLGGSTINTSFLANHEELHIWQSRIFGPIYQVGTVIWAIGGFLVAVGYWAATGFDKNLGSLIQTAAYYDSPFEYWAYKNDNNWPPKGAHPDLTW